jgi:hypothetical protein
LQDFQLLSPEEDVDEIYPYRRVWRTLIIEMVLLFALMIGIFAAIQFEVVEDTYLGLLGTGVVLAPLGFFILITIQGERRALQPRTGLLTVVLVSGIVANGVGVPLVNLIFTPEQWLPEAGFFTRIFGYMLTVGVTAEFLKYAVVRYTVWPNNFTMRVDGIACGVAAALGYATVFNLRDMLLEQPTLSAGTFQVVTFVYWHISIGAILGYFLAELAIGQPSLIWLPLGLFIGSFLNGIYAAFRGIAIVGGLGNRAIGGVLVITGFSIVVLGIMSFLIDSADRRMEQQTGIEHLR